MGGENLSIDRSQSEERNRADPTTFIRAMIPAARRKLRHDMIHTFNHLAICELIRRYPWMRKEIDLEFGMRPKEQAVAGVIQWVFAVKQPKWLAAWVQYFTTSPTAHPDRCPGYLKPFLWKVLVKETHKILTADVGNVAMIAGILGDFEASRKPKFEQVVNLDLAIFAEDDNKREMLKRNEEKIREFNKLKVET